MRYRHSPWILHRHNILQIRFTHILDFSRWNSQIVNLTYSNCHLIHALKYHAKYDSSNVTLVLCIQFSGFFRHFNESRTISLSSFVFLHQAPSKGPALQLLPCPSYQQHLFILLVMFHICTYVCVDTHTHTYKYNLMDAFLFVCM